ncbi:MAG: glycine cleavage system protein R [Sideroxydans sp.]
MNGTNAPDTLLITATGKDQRGLVLRLTERIHDSGCNIEESRMTVLDGQAVLVLLVGGPWHALSRLEAQLPAAAEQLDLHLHFVRAQKTEGARSALPYNVETVTLDQPGVVRNLALFFYRRNIAITDVQSSTYVAPQTGARMCSVLMTVGVPAEVHIATLRGDFFDYCDDINLDATFEPVRG